MPRKLFTPFTAPLTASSAESAKSEALSLIPPINPPIRCLPMFLKESILSSITCFAFDIKSRTVSLRFDNLSLIPLISPEFIILEPTSLISTTPPVSTRTAARINALNKFRMSFANRSELLSMALIIPSMKLKSKLTPD